MVVQYCQTYTDREHGRILTYGSYGPYEVKMASRVVRTVRFVKRIYGSWIQLFNRWKNQVMTKWSLEKFVDPYGSYGPYELKMVSRIVRTVRFVKRIYGSWIQLFNRWESQVMTKWSLEKFVYPYGSYGPYQLKMASRIVWTVRFVKRIYGSWIQLFNRRNRLWLSEA